MVENVLIRKYREGDEENIVNLLQLVFKDWPTLDISCSPLEYWRWKHQTGTNKNFVTVAEHENQIIGCHHAIEVTIQVNNKALPCTTTCDFAVHPDYRKKGISQKMGYNYSRPWRTKEGMVFDYFIVGNPILVKSFSKTRPKFPIKIINMTNIRDINLHTQKNPRKNNTLLRNGYKILCNINNIKNKLTKPTKPYKYEITETHTFPEHMNTFWEATSHYYDFIIKRDTEVLNHRYCDPRNRASKIFIAKNKDEIQGYAVLRINRYNPDYPVGYIVDLLARPDQNHAIGALVSKSMEYFNENEINIVNCQIPRKHEYTGILSKLGFIDSRVSLYIFYVPSNEGMILHKQLPEDAKVYLSWGDHDVLPAFKPKYEK